MTTGNKSKALIAEMIGTFALVFAGCGAIMVWQRFPGTVAPGAIAMVFGLVVGAMIYAVGHISGAHFNPAVTLGSAVVGRFPRWDVPRYWAAQPAGAYLFPHVRDHCSGHRHPGSRTHRGFRLP